MHIPVQAHLYTYNARVLTVKCSVYVPTYWKPFKLRKVGHVPHLKFEAEAASLQICA